MLKKNQEHIELGYRGLHCIPMWLPYYIEKIGRIDEMPLLYMHGLLIISLKLALICGSERGMMVQKWKEKEDWSYLQITKIVQMVKLLIIILYV